MLCLGSDISTQDCQYPNHTSCRWQLQWSWLTNQKTCNEDYLTQMPLMVISYSTVHIPSHKNGVVRNYDASEVDQNASRTRKYNKVCNRILKGRNKYQLHEEVKWEIQQKVSPVFGEMIKISTNKRNLTFLSLFRMRNSLKTYLHNKIRLCNKRSLYLTPMDPFKHLFASERLLSSKKRNYKIYINIGFHRRSTTRYLDMLNKITGCSSIWKDFITSNM